MSGGSDEWESLRRQAKKIERVLEEKVSAYSRLGQRMNSDLLYDEENPLMEGREEQALVVEIETLLSQLNECNDRMGVCVQANSSNTANAALLQRYREVYFDFKRDFSDTATSMSRKREQAELFRGAALSRKGDGGDGGQSHLMREQDSLNSSLNAAGNVIGQAGEVRSALSSQRKLIEGSSGHLAALHNRFPAVARVIGSIQQRRYRDNMVVALAIALCICFSLYWLFG